jgi:photosystem II stability/assembly factor-like uncharacterized protein
MKKIFCHIALICFLINNFSLGQLNFTEQTSGVTTTLKSASALMGGSVAWICGYSGVVLKTTNTGTNWINVSGNGIPGTASLISISCIDQNNAITAGYIGSNTFVYRTSNGGLNWSQVFTETGGFINAIYLSTNSGSGFMYGDPVGGRWSLWKTTNSGATWDSTGLYLPQAGSEAGWNNAISVNGNHIWFGTNNSRIYHSRNYGLNWTVQSTTPEVNSYAVFFPTFLYDTSYGFAGGTTLLLTTNSGMNWRDTTAPGTGSFGGFTEGMWGGSNFPPMLMFYVRNNVICMYFSYPYFSAVYTAPSGAYSHISPYFTGNAYAVRTLGGITRVLTFFGGGIKKISSLVPDGFRLYDNYPNPFNPSTKIKFDVQLSPLSERGVGGFITLKIYDALGREVETLVNEKLTPGTYEVEWNAEKYTSGIYFYRLTTDGYSVTKKMVLIK